jgi:hypothetical protein
VGWFEAAAPQLFQPSNFPVFIMQDPATQTAFYGFPEFGGPGEEHAALCKLSPVGHVCPVYYVCVV